MVYERWEIQFDIKKLQQHLNEFVLPLELTAQSKAFGGWSVLSSDGTHTDGWHQGHKLYDANADLSSVHTELQKSKAKKPAEYTIPTEICHGYLNEVIETIAAHKLTPHRARIIRLSAGGASIWHQDAPSDVYGIRLHVPIQTNDGCFFETETEKAHLTADGSAYFLAVNRLHRVINSGPTDRYHLVMDVEDFHGITKFHRHSDFINSRN